jgi:glycosyltransferase involved in cell wall biosynthesis
MTVLHLCSDFAKQSIYSDLLAALGVSGLKQIAFAPVRTLYEVERTAELERKSTGPVVLSKILTPIDRIFFRRKVRKVLQTLEQKVDLSKVNLLHAHFWYSDGAVALELHRRRKLPFVVAVRNTDVNSFLKLRPDLFGLATEILVAASRIVFITPSYVERVLATLSDANRRKVEDKITIVPNGISSFWLDDTGGELRRRNPDAGDLLRVLYVGDLSPNKNLRNLLSAVEILDRSRRTCLTIVGSGGSDENWVRSRVASGDGRVNWIGRLSDPLALREVYRQHDVFAMPSLRETFGVVYLEALSQGLPILHSRGEGVDGYFKSFDIAEAVDPRNTQEIAEKLAILAAKTPDVATRCRQMAGRFEWKRVAQQYLDIYNNVLEGSQTRDR